MTSTNYDAARIITCPVSPQGTDDRALATFLLAVASAGYIRTTSLKAFTEAEFQGIVDDLP